MGKITLAMKARYETEGYLVVPDVLSGGEVRTLCAVIDRFVEQSRSITESTSAIELAAGHTAKEPRLRRIVWPHLLAPEFKALLRHPSILEVVKALLGPDLRYHHSKLTLKLAHHGEPVEWHQDWAFYPHTNDSVLEVGLCLDDVTLENGPLMVSPGSHRGPIYDHHAHGRFCGAVASSVLRDLEIVPMLGPAGSMTVHHVRTLHGSGPNLSDRPRRFYLMGYSAADAWPLTAVPGFDPASYYQEAMVAGVPNLTPRMEALAVRLPYPSPSTGSIYEVQKNHPQRVYG